MTMKKIWFVFVVLWLLHSACQTKQQGSFDETSVISMQKTECYGTCPVYSITIKGSGQATLEAQKHLDKTGTYQMQLSREETDALFKSFVKADLWSFENEYTADISDLPTTYLTFTNKGKVKKIKDYSGAPQQLIDLENQLAGLITSSRWSREGGKGEPLSSTLDLSKKGEYLVTVGGCHDCHSPKVFTAQGPVPDESRLLSGHPSDMPVASYSPDILKDWVLFNAHNTAVAGPWGVSFAANLTSDDTGIGLWKEEQFIKAIREGKYKGMDGGRPLLPPMPWPNFAKMTDEDLKAIFAYLKSTKPVRNVVPAPMPPVQLSMK